MRGVKVSEKKVGIPESVTLSADVRVQNSQQSAS